MQHVVIIANPFAGPSKGRLTGVVASQLVTEAGFHAEFRPTKGPGHATELARQASAEGADLVVSLGGDGTVHEVARGLAGTETPMGVLPSGSGNDFARAVGCFTVDEALQTFRTGYDQTMDTASLNGDFFINSLGLLASGLISVRSARLWRMLGPRRYVLASAATLLTYFGQEIHWRLHLGAELVLDHKGRYLLAEICNAPFTGGGFRFAPDARPDDGILDACLVRRIAPWTAMIQLPKATSGKCLDHPAISVSPCTRLEFTVERKVAFHRDGEAGFLPAGTHVVQVEKQNIKVRVPARWQQDPLLEKI
jgi:diacylglycerol kinase (ATP)